MFLHDRPWISPWIKSISHELFIIHVIVSQLSGYCSIINKRLWRHQQNANPASKAQGRCVKIVVLSSFLSWFCRVRNKIMYVLSWRTVFVLIPVLCWGIFPSYKGFILLTVCYCIIDPETMPRCFLLQAYFTIRKDAIKRQIWFHSLRKTARNMFILEL